MKNDTTSTKQVYIYKLIDSITRTPFYVGKGTGKRMYDHVAQRLLCSPQSTHKNRLLKNKINKILASGGHIRYHSRIVPSEAVAFDLERRLITKYGRRDIRTGVLCNMTNGGEGVSGHVRSDQWKQQSRERNEKRAKSVDQYTIDGTLIKTWVTIKEAIFNTPKTDTSSISQCCNNKIRSSGGFRWSWHRSTLSAWSHVRLQHKPHKPHKPHKEHTGRKVYQYTPDGHKVAEYNSLEAAGKTIGKHANTVLECCAKRSSIAGGYVFRYTDDFTGYEPTVFQYDHTGTLIGSYYSIASAALATNLSRGIIGNALHQPTCRGGQWYWRKIKMSYIIPHVKPTSGIPVVQYAKNGDIIATYPSTRQAIQQTGIKGISNCVAGLAKTAGGYTWKQI